MKKNIVILSISAAFAILSCKKSEPVVHGENSIAATPVNAPTPILSTEEELLKEAKSKPLTTIALAGSNFDFGKIKKGETVQHDYEITNTGDKPLVISSVKPGCGCTAPDYTKTPILPGQKGKITLKFDSSNFEGVVHKFANVYANVEKAPINITFTADIQP